MVTLCRVTNADAPSVLLTKALSTFLHFCLRVCSLTSLMGETGSFQRPSASAVRPASSASSPAHRIRAAASARGLQLGRLLRSISSLSACKAPHLLFATQLLRL